MRATIKKPIARLLGGVVLALGLGGAEECEPSVGGPARWAFWGGDLVNSHHAHGETQISVQSVGRLSRVWTYQATGSISAIPTVSENHVYVTDWGPPFGGIGLPGGSLHAIDRQTGARVWSHLISEYAPNKLYNLSRSSPAIVEDLLIFGDWIEGPLELLASLVNLDPTSGGTTLYAVRRDTGELVWKTTLDSHPTSAITQSPVVHDGKVFVGVSSRESAMAKFPYPCCTFRGSMVALDVRTGELLWKTYMVPDNQGRVGGFSGGAVWGGAPTIDVERQLVYVATGQNYDVPAPLKDCLAAHAGDAALQQSECLDRLDPEDNRHNAVVALELDTGAIRWSKKLYGYDAWNFSCDPRIIPWIPPVSANCPTPAGGDLDFGQAPMLMRVQRDGAMRDLLAVGQKSGLFWGLDPDRNGEMVWVTAVGPGGILGGVEFGAANDGTRIFTQITNFEGTQFALTAGPNRGVIAKGGIWAALDAASGELLWQTPDPTSALPRSGALVHPVWGASLGDGFFGFTPGPLAVANGVVFGGSMDRAGHMYGFDARDGRILWQFESGGSVMSAPSIVDGTVYWGSGYLTGFTNDKLYAFRVGD